MSHSLLERNLYRYDFIARLLVEKLHCSPVMAGIWSIMTFVILVFLAALASSTLWSNPGQTGLLQDPIPWIAIILINPVVCGYYLWSFRAIINVIQALEASNAVNIDRLEIDRTASNLYRKKWRYLSAIVVALSFSIFVFNSQPRLEKSWTSSSFLPNLCISIATLAVTYVGSVLIFNLMNNIQILHSIFTRKNLNVNLLHPDRSGGLRSLSDYSLKTAYLIAILGVWLGVVAYQFITQGSKQDYWYLILIFSLYIILSVTCFFGPLLTAHQGMKKAKDDLLHEIARQFEADYSHMRNGLTEDAETLKKRTEKIQELRVVYAMTDEFPVWPFNVQTFKQYLLTAPAPFIVPILGMLRKGIEALLNQWGINLG